MRWPPWTSNAQATNNDHPTTTDNKTDPKNLLDWSAYTELRTLIPTLVLTTGILSAFTLHRTYLRRFPTAVNITPAYYRRRSILGKVTSVGDGDNFRIYHTPGGRLAGWGWVPWKKVPTTRKELRDQTIHVRLAGVDAPEQAHFGRPAQPFGKEAHEWLTGYLTGRRVRIYVHRQDQYQRVVATVFVRRALDFPIPFRRRDVGYEMLRKGLATVYEAKVGAEFGGEVMEKKYRSAEWWAKARGLGLWKGFKKDRNTWESPREFKTRTGMEDGGQGKK
ncbi:putative endonuclease lcl3 [Aspergillus tubingensis]|uniref:Probable endonuclease LCL3 n=1 Tax=Aspergillus niger TaxID=5061 RepID=A0A124BUQ0_ASPNG|nr:staphylococcal nuclease domain protein [Aspergillus niger]GLA78932.1 putative endonuclease lcl3 [Aspergillus tubingensis]